MDATIAAYLRLLRKVPGLLDVALDVALGDMDHIATESGLIERLSANVISVGQAAQARSDVRQLQATLKTHRRTVVHRHALFHQRQVHRFSLTYQEHARSSARAAAAGQGPINDMQGLRPDLCSVLDESLAAMCGRELVSLQEGMRCLSREGRFGPFHSPVTQASLSQGLTFAMAPAWHRTLAPGLAAYVGHLYGDVMCATLQELMRLVDIELLQISRLHTQLSVQTDSGFNLTVPGAQSPPAALLSPKRS